MRIMWINCGVDYSGRYRANRVNMRRRRGANNDVC